MEFPKPTMASADSDSDLSLAPPPEVQSQLSSLIYDMSNQMQGAMVNMLKMISEIDQNSADIVEDIEKSKDSALQRKKVLEEEKERFQEAAYAALSMLSKTG